MFHIKKIVLANFVMIILANSVLASEINLNAGAPAQGCGAKSSQGFATRFYQTYKEHLAVTGEEPSTAAYRGTEPQLSSPPFPGSTFPIGGTSPIGYEDTTVSPLMDTLYCGEDGQAIKDSRIKIYGWLAPGFNLSSSTSKYSTSSGIGGNYPASYYAYPNSLQLHQATLYVERVPDTVQTDHLDWGFRLANLYGTDYKYTFSNKLLSQQYLRDGKMYGYDPVMFYGDLYIPKVAEGMNIRVGRYISIPDIEAQLAPNNYTFSHSLLYGYDPYTRTGIVNTVKLNKNWTAQFEISNGTDNALWDKQNRKLTPGACINWTSDSGNDNIYPCINGLNSGEYGYNNLQMLVATWYHKFNPKWHMATEGWYMWQNDVPSVNNENAPPLIKGSNGATCKAGDLTCRANQWAAVHYFLYQFAPRDFITFRNEFFKDNRGQRTGYQTLYSEHLIGWTHWIGDVITIRPEIRFERSYDKAAYNGGESHNQYIFATDMIIHY
ncbi:MAG: outer membrane beta-barrel protein [Pseudomonadota bacterium]